MKRLNIASYILNILLIVGLSYIAFRHLNPSWGVTLVAAQHKVTDNQQYNEQLKIWDAYPNKVKRIVMLGDSYTYKCQWEELFDSCSISNQGVDSDVTEGYLMRIRYVFSRVPKICFIEGGSIDIEYHVPVARIMANLTKIVDTLEGFHVIPVLSTLPYESATLPGADAYNQTVDSLNNLISFYAQTDSVDLIDLNELTKYRGALAPEFAQNDGVHFTAGPYRLWGGEILRVLKKYNLDKR